MKSLRHALIIMFFFLTACGGASGNPKSQPVTSAYIQNKGSDTIVNLALAWAEKYQSEHPDISISVTGGGSGTGIAALLNKTVDIANASRQMQPEEIQQAKADGFDPVEFVIARDAIAVIVNPTNPVNRLTIQQISDIYTGKIDNWTQVGERIAQSCGFPGRSIPGRMFTSGIPSYAWGIRIISHSLQPIPCCCPPPRES